MRKIPKKWRELPIKEKLLIPEKVFNIDKKEIERIRKIENPKKRLIASGKAQFDLFGEVHSYLTSWLAGYASDITIRHYFISTENFRQLFIKSPKKTKGIIYSWSDIKRGIKIPMSMSSELAEETGIHIGDGHLFIRKDKKGYLNYGYSITGDLANELSYHKDYVAKLMKKLYNINASFLERRNKNSMESKYFSKAIVEFKNKILRLPKGSKKDISIPLQILTNNQYAKKCVVGIIDTDFNVTCSLAISGKMHTLIAAEQVHDILEKNNIKHIYRKYEDYSRFYIPKRFAKIVVEKWRMHNKKHISKFEVFNKFRKFIPFTTTNERVGLLEGSINLDELEIISKKRALEKKPISTYKDV